MVELVATCRLTLLLVFVLDRDCVGTQIHHQQHRFMMNTNDVTLGATQQPRFDKRNIACVHFILTAQDIPDTPDESPQPQHRSCVSWNVHRALGRLGRTG